MPNRYRETVPSRNGGRWAGRCRVLKRRSLAALVALLLLQGITFAEEGWRAEFDATCAKTGDAMELSVGDLTQLIERCDALQKVVENQEESVRKVYLKRLQMCRNLYAYVLDYKKQNQRAQ